MLRIDETHSFFMNHLFSSVTGICFVHNNIMPTNFDQFEKNCQLYVTESKPSKLIATSFFQVLFFSIHNSKAPKQKIWSQSSKKRSFSMKISRLRAWENPFSCGVSQNFKVPFQQNFLPFFFQKKFVFSQKVIPKRGVKKSFESVPL